MVNITNIVLMTLETFTFNVRCYCKKIRDPALKQNTHTFLKLSSNMSGFTFCTKILVCQKLKKIISVGKFVKQL